MKFRLITYNVHKCIGGLDRRYDPARVHETIAHYAPDVVLLQEVDDQARRSNHHRQVDVLGDLLEMRHRTWFPNVKVRGGGTYGNAILSKFPLAESTNIDLTIGRRKRRSVLHARFRVGDGSSGSETRTVHVYNLHLGLSGAERKLQLQRFMSSDPLRGLHHNTPVIIAGDFNDVWGTLGPQLLIPAGFRNHGGPLRTFPAYAPMRALDSVYVKGDAEIEHVQRSRLALAKRASDHLPLIADVLIR